MRHASAAHGGARRKVSINEYCTEVLDDRLVQSLKIAATRAQRKVEKPRLARKKVYQAALEELCKRARQLHSQSTEQHVEEQRIFTLRGLPANADTQRTREYEATVAHMVEDIRAGASAVQTEVYDAAALSVPENSLRIVCDYLRILPGQALEHGDHILLQEFGQGAREYLADLVLGALAMHCESLEVNIASNAQAAAQHTRGAHKWAGCMQLAHQQAAAAELKQRRDASANTQQLQQLVCTLESEWEHEVRKGAVHP